MFYLFFYFPAAPEAPEDIKALILAPDAILVSWKPPIKTHGVLQRYTVYSRSHGFGEQASPVNCLLAHYSVDTLGCPSICSLLFATRSGTLWYTVSVPSYIEFFSSGRHNLSSVGKQPGTLILHPRDSCAFLGRIVIPGC